MEKLEEINDNNLEEKCLNAESWAIQAQQLLAKIKQQITNKPLDIISTNRNKKIYNNGLIMEQNFKEQCAKIQR